MAEADPVAIFGVAGFTILLLMGACRVLYKRLLQREDQLDTLAAQSIAVNMQTVAALEATSELVRESIREVRSR